MREVLAVGFMVAVLAACGSAGPTQDQYDELQAQVDALEHQLYDATSTTATTVLANRSLRGVFNLESGYGFNKEIGEICHGSGGYDDIKAGLGVVVMDGGGDVVGVSELTGGEVTPDHPEWVESNPKLVSLGCAFEFAVSIPADLDFYTIEVGSRGDLSFTRADLEATDWTVAFTLG